MDTRGTQTDLVTDRNIADCLMELKSSPEFQDLTYRLSRSCTGEMTLTVTRESTVGLLGAPFDPVYATVTASGLCYFSVLFAPMEVTDLKPNGDLNLRKFRHILWKLNGRAGYGFCPGFKDTDFPEGFKFEGHGLEVLKQPFTRVQATECQVFMQLKRSSSRAISQPLGLQLCSKCLKALTDIYTNLKKSGADLSKCPAFTRFLPGQSHPTAVKNHGVYQGSSKLKESNELKTESEASLLVTEEEGGGEGSSVGADRPGLCVASECEVVTQNSTESKPKIVKSSSSKVPVRNCSVLLDRFIPEGGCLYKSENRSNMVVANGAVSADSSPVPSPATRSLEHTSSAASFSQDVSHSSSSSSWSLMSSPSATVTSNSSKRQLKHTSSESSSSSRPVLSARIKPFRTVTPQGQETEFSVTDAAGADVAVAGVASDTVVQRDVMADMEPPPVLTPEIMSPADSPQPLCIDEDADPDELESASSEPDAKRPCYRCSLCEDGFQSDTELRQHFSESHPQDTSQDDQSETLATSDLVTDEPVQSDSESPRWKVCPVCRKSFSTKEELELHLTSRHHTRLHRCRYCGQRFALRKNLTDHLERHRGSKKLICEDCGKEFSKKKDFAAHVREHMGDLPFFCTICSKLFSRESVYKEHMERHRARRGVRAVLSGSQKTLQGIVTKAKKCLDEKALMTPASTVTPASGAVQVTTVAKSSSTDSLSTSTSESATSPPSNLHLLSVVSLAQAELEKTSRPPSVEEKMSTSATESSDAAAQLLQLSSRETDKVNAAISDSASTVSPEDIKDTKMDVVSQKAWPEESNALLQKLNAPLKLSKSPPVVLPELSQEQTLSIADKAQSSASSSDDSAETGPELKKPGLPGSSQQGTTPQPTSGTEETEKKEKEKLLSEREEKVKKKEKEMKEREQDIARKNMVFFHQLLMAQMTQQPKNGNGGPATPSEQNKGDKPPMHPQALAMMAALNSRAARGMGQGAIPVLRPPVPPHLPSNKPPYPIPADVGPKWCPPTLDAGKGMAVPHTQPGPLPVTNTEQVKSPASDAVPSSSAGASPPSISLPPHASASLHPKHNPLNPASPRMPFGSLSPGARMSPASLPPGVRMPPRSPLPPGSLSPSARMPSRSPQPPLYLPPGVRMPPRPPTASPRSPATSNQQPARQASSPRKGNFLDMLVGLESKMPDSVKQFLPPRGPVLKARLPKPSQSVFLSDKGSGVILHAETPESIARAIGNKGKGRWPKTKGLDGTMEGTGLNRTDAPPPPPKKQSRWSGGLVKEQLNSVVTVVSPQEMKRLMSITKDFSRVPTPTPEAAASQSNFSARLASPPAYSPISSRTGGSSGQPSPAAPSPMSSTQTTGGPPSSAASTGSPASHSPSPPSPSPSLPLKSMPRLVPASALHAVSSQIMPWLPKNSPAPTLAEETGPMDLTKGSTSNRATLENRSEENRPAGKEAQQSLVLRHILLDPPVSRNQSPAGRQSVASGRSWMDAARHNAANGGRQSVASGRSWMDAASDNFVRDCIPQGGFNAQAAALQAQLQASLQAAENNPRLKANPTLRPFLPGMSADPAQIRGGQPPPFPGLPPGMILPQGMLGLQFMGGGPLSPPLGFVPPPSGPRRSPSTSAAGSSTGRSSLSSPASTVSAQASSSTGRSSLPSPTSTVCARASSPPSSVSSGGTSSLGSPPGFLATLPNFLIPESDGAARCGSKQAGSEGEENKLAINPLGGFAWHRPATIDPFSVAEKMSREHNQAEEREARRDKNTPEDEDTDLTEDRNQWQRQFLQTLWEKRRQQQEQQLLRQQRRQQVLTLSPHSAQNGTPPAKRGRRRKKDMSEAATGGGADQTQFPGSFSSQHASSLLAEEEIIASQAQHNDASPAKRSRGKSGRGRPRGRPRKNAAQRTEEPARVETEVEEEGAEFMGFGSGEEVKVEPLEAGVTCDTCSMVLYGEKEILEHDCDV
ncbi:hypothetical protein V1264_016318 [Littorina saxatilis]